MGDHMQIATLTQKVLARSQSFLHDDLGMQRERIADAVRGTRILVIGAAGSIGAAFTREVVAYGPRALHLVDISENNLAEVVRDFRSSDVALPDDFATYAIDFGGVEMHALLSAQSYDYVLNFSALKHVRSERDPYTLMRLLDVNVLANERLLDSLAATHQPEKIFAVSSDKSVRPANLMGASKSFMERVFLARSDVQTFGSARFANVAFSDGSLLHSFGQRLAKRQPISAPSDVRRYFISHREAGQLCLLGCFATANTEIVVPDFLPDEDMQTFSQIAETFLKENGYTPIHCGSEQEARDMAAGLSANSREWPCHFTGSDTAGEKMFEEFAYPDEPVDADRFQEVNVITDPKRTAPEALNSSLDALKSLRSAGSWSAGDLFDIVQQAVPELAHATSTKNLDQKM